MKMLLQHDKMDCGAACLAMVSSHYGKDYSLQQLRDYCFLTKNGVSLLGICGAADMIGFEKALVKLDVEQLNGEKIQKPLILHWNKNHFVVLRKVKKSLINGKLSFKIADPGHGLITLSEEKFRQSWLSDDEKGIALLLTPTEKFYEHEVLHENKVRTKYLFKYLMPFRKKLILMSLLLLVGSGLILVFPFLTEALIDQGVNAKNLNYIFIILFAQLGVYLGSITIEIFRNWLMLYVGTKLSISIISQFLKKVLQLPIKFFDTKMMTPYIYKS